MAPGDHAFHVVSYSIDTMHNNFKSQPSRAEAEEYFTNLGDKPKILVSGETGDVLMASGDQNMID